MRHPSDMETLLIIEQSKQMSRQLKYMLENHYAILLAADRNKALSLFEKYLPKVVLLNLGLPPSAIGAEEGLRCLEALLTTRPLTKVIVMMRNRKKENALRAIRMGAYHLYQKPVVTGKLKAIIDKALDLYSIEEKNRRLEDVLDKKNAFMAGMIGECPAMLEVFSLMRKVAYSNISVLIRGESGTGKELVAKAIHLLDTKNDGPFVPINCAAIPENLFESELFGYERGAFTGAYTKLHGKIELAHKGTLFLDEIGEFPVQLQVKLLRFLQEKTVQRIGGREDIRIDARIIAASNKDVVKAIKESRFREDLYYRIGGITISLPPLRERGDDIMLLSNFFLRRSSAELRKRVKGFKSSSLELLKSYAWPGNVRELENRVKRAVIMSESPMIEPHDLGFTEKKTVQQGIRKACLTLKEVRDKAEKEMIISTLDRHEGVIARTARELDISRPTLYDLMKKHGIYYYSMSD